MTHLGKGVWGFGAVLLLFDCLQEPAAPTKEQLEHQYLDELITCVETSHTREESDKCREEVDRKYGVKR